MKQLSSILQHRKKQTKRPLDEKSLSYLINRLIKDEYGTQGAVKIKFEYFTDGKIFLKTANSNWYNEIWLNREELINKINFQIGTKQVKEIVVSY